MEKSPLLLEATPLLQQREHDETQEERKKMEKTGGKQPEVITDDKDADR